MFVKQSKKTATLPSMKPLPSNPAEEGVDAAINEINDAMQSPHTAGGLAHAHPQTDEEAQQIATSRALATAKDILQKGGTQAEAAEGAKVVARQVLREFQLSKQALLVKQEIADVGMTTKTVDKPRKMKLPNSHHVSSLKNFWRKGKKNKTGNSPVIEEARDEEVEINSPQPAGTVLAQSPAALPLVHDASEARDEAETAQPVKEELDRPLVEENKATTEISQTHQEVNESSESSSNNNTISSQSKTEERAPAQTKQRKHQAKTQAAREGRQAPPGHNAINQPNLSQTYSQGSSGSDNYSWNEYDRGNLIYLRDNESVSVLTKEYRDPNIMDVLSLEAVMEVVNKGIITREDGDGESRRHSSRLGGNDMKDEEENSVDGIVNCLWNALDCCGENSLVSERQCYLDRCHRGSSRGFGSSKIVLNDDGQYFGHHRKSERVGAESVGLEMIAERGIPSNAINNDVGGKSVSWADDTVDNIILDGSLNDGSLIDDAIDRNGEKSSKKYHFNRSRSNSSDGRGSRASIKSAVKSSLKNAKTMIQCATAGVKQPVDADTVYEQHRHAAMTDNARDNANAANQDNPNWRDIVNDSSNDRNWRAAVNDRPNYQGPNSPTSSNRGGLSPVGDVYGLPRHRDHQQWGVPPAQPTGGGLLPNHASMPLTRMPSYGHQSANASPPPGMGMNARIPSMGNRSIATNAMSMSLSIDSGDIGDKYGMEEEGAPRHIVSHYANHGTVPNGVMMHHENSQYIQYATNQLMTQDSVMGGNDRYGDGYRAMAGNNVMQANPSLPPTDSTMNIHKGGQDYAYGMSSPQCHYEMQASGNYESSSPQPMKHTSMAQTTLQKGPQNMGGYDNLHYQPPMQQHAPASPQQTFFA